MARLPPGHPADEVRGLVGGATEAPPSGAFDAVGLGLARHLTEVERWWFRMHAGGEQLDFPNDLDQTGADFDHTADAEAEANLSAYLEEIQAARAAVAGKDLDLVVPSRGHHQERTRDIRWIYIHMIEEYARHNGHADLLREAIDGSTGD